MKLKLFHLNQKFMEILNSYIMNIIIKIILQNIMIIFMKENLEKKFIIFYMNIM